MLSKTMYTYASNNIPSYIHFSSYVYEESTPQGFPSSSHSPILPT